MGYFHGFKFKIKLYLLYHIISNLIQSKYILLFEFTCHFPSYHMISSHHKRLHIIPLHIISESLVHVYQPPQHIGQLRRPLEDEGQLRRPNGGGLPHQQREPAIRFQQVVAKQKHCPYPHSPIFMHFQRNSEQPLPDSQSSPDSHYSLESPDSPESQFSSTFFNLF